MSAHMTWTPSLLEAAYAAMMDRRLRQWADSIGATEKAARSAAHRYSDTNGLPKASNAPSPLDAVDLTLPTREIAAMTGRSYAAINLARQRHGIEAPEREVKARPSVRDIGDDELARTPSWKIGRRCGCSTQAVSDERAARGMTGARPDLMVLSPQVHTPATREAMRVSEEEDISRGAVPIRVGPRFTVDARAYDSRKLTYDPAATPDPRWEARFLSREPQRRGMWDESV